MICPRSVLFILVDDFQVHLLFDASLRGVYYSRTLAEREGGRLRVVINRAFFLAFRVFFPDFRFFFRVSRNFFSPGKIPRNEFPVSRKSPASSQNNGQAHRVSHVRHVTTRHCTG